MYRTKDIQYFMIRCSLCPFGPFLLAQSHFIPILTGKLKINITKGIGNNNQCCLMDDTHLVSLLFITLNHPYFLFLIHNF